MIIAFYCKECGLDQELEACISTFYGGGKKFVAKCKKCKDELFRLIDEKENDPYFYLSKNVIINRNKFAKDILQPTDKAFKLYYRKEYEKIEKKREEYERRMARKKKERDEFYKNMLDKGLAKKILDNEEKINA